MVQSRSPVTLLSFRLQLATDQTFQMRYITSLNSQWFKNDKSSKLKVQKKSVFLTKTDFVRTFKFDDLSFLKHWEFRHVMYLI